MNSETLRIIGDFVTPLFGLTLLLAIGLFFWLIRFRKFAAFCILLAAVLLYFASTPFTARKLMDSLQYQHAVLKNVPADTQAIVVLSGGRIPIAREYTNLDTVNATGLERLRYASRLAKLHQLPILIAGGSVNDERQSEAALMKVALETDFGVQTTWLEEESKTTFENAEYTRKILKENSIDKVLLVTHAYHMPRAMRCFEGAGLKPVPAPTVFYKRNTSATELNEYIPSASALKQTELAMHEIIGAIWYRYMDN